MNIKHLPLALFTSYCLKYLVLPTTYSDIALIAILGVISVAFQYYSSSKEIKELKDKIDSNHVEFKATAKELTEIKTKLIGVNIGQMLRPTKLG